MWKVDMKRRGGRQLRLAPAEVMRNEANRLERMPSIIQVEQDGNSSFACLEFVEFDHDKIRCAAACR